MSTTTAPKAAAAEQSRAEVIAATNGPVGPLSFSVASAEQLSSTSSASSPSLDCAVLFLTEEAASSQSLDLSAFHTLLPSASLSPTPSTWQDFTGKAKQTLYLYPSAASSVPRLLLVGLGKAKDVTASSLRSAVHAMVASLKHKRVKQAAVALPTGLPTVLSSSTVVDVFTRISVLSNHSFTRYLTKKEGDRHHSLERLHFLLPSASSDSLAAVVNRAQAIAESQLMARELINDRGDAISPSVVETFASQLARTHQLPIRVVKGDQLKDEGLTLISAVGQGSREGENARIIVIEYTGDEERKEEKLALVGKTITFDTGGLNLKPTGGRSSSPLP